MKKLLISLIAFVATAAAQCPTGTTFPGSVDTNASLGVAVNNLNTNLNASQGPSDTTAIVLSTTGWQPYMAMTTDIGTSMEIEFVTGVVSGTVLSVARGCEGTIALNHSSGSPAVNNVTAYTGSTGPKSAIVALENYVLGGGLNGVINSGAQYQIPYYVTNPTGTVIGGDSGLTYNQPSALLTATNASLGALTVTTSATLPITGSTQCLQVDSGGLISGSGSMCGSGSGGSGTVNPAPQYEVAYYANSGSTAAVSGHTGFTWNGTTVVVPALTLTGASGCLSASGGVITGSGAACGSINSGSTTEVAFYASSGTTLSGVGGFTYNTGTDLLTIPNLSINNITGGSCLQGNGASAVSGSGAPCPILSSGTSGNVPFFSGTYTLANSNNFNYNNSTNKLSVPNMNVTGLSSGDVVYTGASGALTATSAFSFNSGVLGGELSVPTVVISNTLYMGSTASNSVYRCTTAGTLPVGALTTVLSDCGSSAGTYLNIQVP